MTVFTIYLTDRAMSFRCCRSSESPSSARHAAQVGQRAVYDVSARHPREVAELFDSYNLLAGRAANTQARGIITADDVISMLRNS